MSAGTRPPAFSFVEAIRSSGLSIYDPHPKNDALLIPTPQLEGMLKEKLHNVDLVYNAPKTRSKVLKQKIAEVLGYPVPPRFRRRDQNATFPGQNFDVYGQQANNLQVWNQALVIDRRFVIVSISDVNRVQTVRVITGETLIELAKKQTLTHKLQARFTPPKAAAELFAEEDGIGVVPFLGDSSITLDQTDPASRPTVGQVLPIKVLFERLASLVGQKIAGSKSSKERKGGDLVHRRICEALGYKLFGETGQFPDVRHQLLEVKLQTKQTIDLGYVAPDSHEVLEIGGSEATELKPSDIRYAVIGGKWTANELELTSLSLVTGEKFFTHFKRFGGRDKNSKRQILLPRGFFDPKS